MITGHTGAYNILVTLTADLSVGSRPTKWRDGNGALRRVALDTSSSQVAERQTDSGFKICKPSS
jgi:hypothetical protein